MRNLLRRLWHIPRKLLVILIELYQRTLSPDHGVLRGMFPYGYCRFDPTCSEFGKRVIAEHGVLIGIPLLLKRLLSCHPWAAVRDEKIMAMLHAEPPSTSPAIPSLRGRAPAEGTQLSVLRDLCR